MVGGQLAAAERKRRRARRRAAPPTSSCAAGPSRRRSRRALDGDGAADHGGERRTGRSNGSRAAGSRRCTRGSNAKASTSRAGPRSSGFVTRAARKRLRADDDLEAPSGVADRARPRRRPVDEHAVRERHAAEPDLLRLPCPEVIDRQSNSATAGRSATTRSAACSARAAGPGRPDRPPVDADDRHHLADGRGGEDLVGVDELCERVRALLHLVADARRRARARRRA